MKCNAITSMSVKEALNIKMRNMECYEHFFDNFVNQCIGQLQTDIVLNACIDIQQMQFLNDCGLQNCVDYASINLSNIINLDTSSWLNNMCRLNVHKIIDKLKNANVEVIPTYVLKISCPLYLNKDYLKKMSDSFINLISINNLNKILKFKVCKVSYANNSNHEYSIIIFIDNLQINAELLGCSEFVFNNHNKVEYFSIDNEQNFTHENDLC